MQRTNKINIWYPKHTHIHALSTNIRYGRCICLNLPSIMSTNAIKSNMWHNSSWDLLLFYVGWLLISNRLGGQSWCVNIVWDTCVWLSNAWECGILSFWVGRDSTTMCSDCALLWWTDSGAMDTISVWRSSVGWVCCKCWCSGIGLLGQNGSCYNIKNKMNLLMISTINLVILSDRTVFGDCWCGSQNWGSCLNK